MHFINKNTARDVELQVTLGSEEDTGEDRLGLDSLKFYLHLEHRLNLTFRWNENGTVLKQLMLKQRDKTQQVQFTLSYGARLVQVGGARVGWGKGSAPS